MQCSSSLAGQTLYPIATLGKGLVKLALQVGLVLSAQLYPLVLIVREVRFNSFLRAARLHDSSAIAKNLRAIFIHPHCLYSDVTATLNQLPVQEIPGPVETKPLWEFDQTLSQRSDWVKGLARETSVPAPIPVGSSGKTYSIQDETIQKIEQCFKQKLLNLQYVFCKLMSFLVYSLALFNISIF